MQHAEEAAERNADRVVDLEDALEDAQRRSDRALDEQERSVLQQNTPALLHTLQSAAGNSPYDTLVHYNNDEVSRGPFYRRGRRAWFQPFCDRGCA